MERLRHVLHRCATGDESLTAKLSGPDARFAALEPRTEALVQLSALGAVGAPEALWRSAIARAFEAGACDEDIVATLISVATIIGHARAASAAPADRARHRLRDRRRPPELTGSLERHPNRMRAPHNGARESSGAQDDSCAPQADHALERWFDGMVSQWRRTRGQASSTTASSPRDASSRSRTWSKCRCGGRSRGSVRSARLADAPTHRDAVPPPCSPAAGTSRQRAHRAGVRAVRVERAVPGRDAERSERGRRCLGTTSPRCIQRVARHVTNRLLTGCGAARGATPSSRRSLRTRSCDPRCLRVRVLAPQSLRRPVPSAVRRITE